MRFIPLILLLTAFPRLAWGETVTLEQALREAVAARPFVQAARQDAAAAAAAVGEARSRYFPRATLSENFVVTDEPATSLFISLNQEELEVRQDADFYNEPATRKDFATRLSIEQALYDPDIAFGRRRAETGAAAAAAGARWSEEQAAFAAFRAYLAVQQAQGSLDWVRATMREAEEILRLASERRLAGVGLKADELRARVRLSEAKRRLLSTENDLLLSRLRLAQAMGRAGGEVSIAGPVDPRQLVPTTGDAGPRADLEALRLRAEEASLAHRQSRVAYLPRLGASASYSLHDEVPFGADAGSWLVGAGLTWELFDGGQRRYGRVRTAAAAQAAAARVREAATQANLAVEEERRRAEEARLQMVTAEEALAEAQESFRLTEQRYQAGLIDLSELLATQAALDRVRFDRLQAEDRFLLALGNTRFQQGDFVQALLSDSQEDAP
ncbi:MAG: TolC family protein [Desulfuromonadales bacterium]